MALIEAHPVSAWRPSKKDLQSLLNSQSLSSIKNKVSRDDLTQIDRLREDMDGSKTSPLNQRKCRRQTDERTQLFIEFVARDLEIKLHNGK